MEADGEFRVRESWRQQFARARCSAGRESPADAGAGARFFVGGDEFAVMAGPCSVETESQLMATAHHVRQAGARVLRGGAFKPRSSPYAFQGWPGGLKLLGRAREATGLAVVTEVMSEVDVALVAEYADICRSARATWKTTRCSKPPPDPDGHPAQARHGGDDCGFFALAQSSSTMATAT